MKRVFNFSGGKTSAMMTIKYYRAGDLVIFADTGREHPKTYKFILDFEAYEGIDVIKVDLNGHETEITSDYNTVLQKQIERKDAFSKLLDKKGNKVVPNRAKRLCTDELKIKATKRYLRSIGIRKFDNFIGFRADEEKRVKRRSQKFVNVHDVFPLYYHGIKKEDVNFFWESKPYNLEIPSILGNCTLCFLKGKNNLIHIMRQFPELATAWLEDERLAANVGINKRRGKNGGRAFFDDVTLAQLFELFQMSLLFSEIDLNELQPAFNCSCTT